MADRREYLRNKNSISIFVVFQPCSIDTSYSCLIMQILQQRCPWDVFQMVIFEYSKTHGRLDCFLRGWDASFFSGILAFITWLPLCGVCILWWPSWGPTPGRTDGQNHCRDHGLTFNCGGGLFSSELYNFYVRYLAPIFNIVGEYPAYPPISDLLFMHSQPFWINFAPWIKVSGQ
jgi:hypothetical protein